MENERTVPAETPDNENSGSQEQPETEEKTEKGKLEQISVPYNDLIRMTRELFSLKAELGERNKQARELALWKELYPEIEPDDAPQAVYDEAQALGIPAAVAYAMYERRSFLESERARAMNESNRGRSTGALGGEGRGELSFTLEEIRAMTPAQVKRHYRQIIKSLGGGR